MVLYQLVCRFLVVSVTKGFRFSLVDATIEARRQWVKFIPLFFFFCLSFSFKSGSTLSAQHFSVFSFQFRLCSAALFPRSCKLWTQFLPDLTDFPSVPKDEFNLHEVFINHLVLSHFHHYHRCSMSLYHGYRHRYIVAVVVIIYFHFSQSPLLALICEYFFH